MPRPISNIAPTIEPRRFSDITLSPQQGERRKSRTTAHATSMYGPPSEIVPMVYAKTAKANILLGLRKNYYQGGMPTPCCGTITWENPMPTFRAVVTSLAVLASTYATSADLSPYQQSVEKWRQSYEARLKADGGWLTVAGLFWLHEGENHFGSDPLNDIVLPADSVPASAGSFDFHAGKTVVHVNSGVPLSLKGKAANGRSEEHTSELQSPDHLVCRLLLEK